MGARILVVDDDPRLADLLRRYLEIEGYTVVVAHDGRKALELVRGRRPDLVLLDLMLPGVDGWDVCRIVRAESDTPIILVTARSTEEDTLLGLDLGADDYITKPFSPREVVARVRAVLRRVGAVPTEERSLFTVGKLTLDTRRHTADLDGDPVDLTPREFAILATLVAEPGRAFSRQAIVSEAFGYDNDVMARTVDAHIRSLRRKLGDDPEDPNYIETVYGVGYRMVER